MVIQITGTNTKNKGAELMLAAIVLHFRERWPEIKLAEKFDEQGNVMFKKLSEEYRTSFM